MNFTSPTKGRLTFDELYKSIIEFVNDAPDLKHYLIVGTDSQCRETDVCFVRALIVYREGKGGKYFYHKEYEKIHHGLKQRLFYETAKSLELATELTKRLSKEEDIKGDLRIEIHLDVSQAGKSKEVIKEVVGMVVGSGYNAKIKPDSYGASKVADKYTK